MKKILIIFIIIFSSSFTKCMQECVDYPGCVICVKEALRKKVIKKLFIPEENKYFCLATNNHIARFYGINEIETRNCKKLDFTNNHLENFDYLETISANEIVELILKKNKILDISESILLMIQEKFPKLKLLDLRKNPIKRLAVAQQAPKNLSYTVLIDDEEDNNPKKRVKISE